MIWGDVPIDRAVRSLLDTDAMGRLRGMSQLGFTFAAFPRARHTRFDHAIGVYHLTRLTLRRIAESGAYLENRDVQAAQAAALLLDAGRYPYSRAIEGIALPGAPTLKELSRRWIENTEVAKVLRSEWDLEPHNVYRLVARGNEEPRGLTPTEHLLRDILFGSLDVDALDRLVRDAKGAQVPYGIVPVQPLIQRLRIVGQENRAVLTLDEDGTGSLQAFVFSRYLMYYNVYGHQALRIPTVMFRRAVQDAVQAGTVTFDKLSELDDAGAFVLVQDGAEPESSTAALMKRLAERRPYHLALEFDERHPNYASLIRLRDDASWRRRVEEAWTRYLTRYRKGVAGPFDILIDLPRGQPLPVGLRLIRRTPLPGERNPVGWQSISGMTEDDLQRYHAPLHRILVATSGEDLAISVRRHAEELFTIAEEVG
ncbi:MAG: superfamily phosphohydrolase [Rubrobacteraceae bacterium]|nr:superfamily phosphohydrolase [Rubrobacteraceae bacterium]